MKLDICIYYFLKRHKMIDDTIYNLLLHMNIATLTVRKMKIVCGIKEELPEKELAERFVSIIRQCDQTSDKFNEQTYITLSQAGINDSSLQEQSRGNLPDEYVKSLIDGMWDLVYTQSSSRKR